MQLYTYPLLAVVLPTSTSTNSGTFMRPSPVSTGIILPSIAQTTPNITSHLIGLSQNIATMTSNLWNGEISYTISTSSTLTTIAILPSSSLQTNTNVSGGIPQTASTLTTGASILKSTNALPPTLLIASSTAAILQIASPTATNTILQMASTTATNTTLQMASTTAANAILQMASTTATNTILQMASTTAANTKISASIFDTIILTSTTTSAATLQVASSSMSDNTLIQPTTSGQSIIPSSYTTNNSASLSLIQLTTTSQPQVLFTSSPTANRSPLPPTPISTSPPVLTFIVSPSHSNEGVLISWATDKEAFTQCTLITPISVLYPTCNQSFSAMNLTEGIYTLIIIATDSMGNTAPPVAHSWTVGMLYL